MDLLAPIFSAVALIGIHFCRPFLLLLFDIETIYRTLLQKFPVFYTDLTEVNLDSFMQTKDKVCKFVSEKRFKDSLPKPCLLEILEEYVKQSSKEIKYLLSIILPRIAGAMFGFGPKVNENTDSVLKVCELNEGKRRKVNDTPLHNIKEERNVGFINYEVKVRGKKELESPSKLVINKRIDILMESSPSDVKSYGKPAQKIKK